MLRRAIYSVGRIFVCMYERPPGHLYEVTLARGIRDLGRIGRKANGGVDYRAVERAAVNSFRRVNKVSDSRCRAGQWVDITTPAFAGHLNLSVFDIRVPATYSSLPSFLSFLLSPMSSFHRWQISRRRQSRTKKLWKLSRFIKRKSTDLLYYLLNYTTYKMANWNAKYRLHKSINIS